MKRLTTILALASLLAASQAAAQPQPPGNFGWTISNSTTNPYSYSGAIAPGPSMFAGNLYLWYFCSVSANGMSAAEFDVQENTGTGAPTGFTPLNGFLNAGGPTNILLAKGGCPGAGGAGVPLLAGSFSVAPDQFAPTMELCMVNSAANNRNVTVECTTGLGHQNEHLGFKKTAVPPNPACQSGSLCGTISVEAQTWGKIKGLYR